ncbi:hypothetical protein [Haliangium sp.]|uniref:hypothetical protein n=1 Tax=Haliangium sp. TaxID=2663208 RepID=UPI003D12042B
MSLRDHLEVAAELQRRFELLDRCESAHEAEFLARLHDLCTILFRNPIVSRVLDSLAQESPALTQIKSELERQILRRVTEVPENIFFYFERIGCIYESIRTVLRGDEAAHVVKKANQPVRYRGTPSGQLHLTEFMDYLRTRHDKKPPLTTQDFEDMDHAMQSVHNLYCEIRIYCHTAKGMSESAKWLEDQEEPLRKAHALLVDELEQAQVVYDTASALAVNVHVKSLRERYAAISSLRHGDISGLYPHNKTTKTRELLPAISRIVSSVCSRLAVRPVQEALVQRLIVYLERFAAERIRDAIGQKEGEGRKGDFREDLIQRCCDEFLFNNGVFPVTHAVAGGARSQLDTFVPTGLRTAKESGMYPLLLELKQDVYISKKHPSRSLAKIEEEAIAQAAEYAKHMEAHPEWRDLKVFVLVVHNRVKRTTARNPAKVRYAYVGSTQPSDAQPAEAEQE